MTVDKFDSQVQPHLLFRDQGRNSDRECVSVGQAGPLQQSAQHSILGCVCAQGG